jgi:hypothetical protein
MSVPRPLALTALLLLGAFPGAAGPKRGWAGDLPRTEGREVERYLLGEFEVVTNCRAQMGEKRLVDCRHTVKGPELKKPLVLKGGDRVLESEFQGGFVLYDEGCCDAPNQGHFYDRAGEFLGYANVYESGPLSDFKNLASPSGFLLVDLRERGEWMKPHRWVVLIPDARGGKPAREPLTLELDKPKDCPVSFITAFTESGGTFSIDYRQSDCGSSGDYEGTCTRAKGSWTCKVTVPER